MSTMRKLVSWFVIFLGLYAVFAVLLFRDWGSHTMIYLSTEWASSQNTNSSGGRALGWPRRFWFSSSRPLVGWAVTQERS
jgi:hypothetical protein